MLIDMFSADFMNDRLEWVNAREPSPVPLEEGKIYRLFLNDSSMVTWNLPRVLLLQLPRIVMPENELRAVCIVINSGHFDIREGAHIEPLAHCFRKDY